MTPGRLRSPSRPGVFSVRRRPRGAEAGPDRQGGDDPEDRPTGLEFGQAEVSEGLGDDRVGDGEQLQEQQPTGHGQDCGQDDGGDSQRAGAGADLQHPARVPWRTDQGLEAAHDQSLHPPPAVVAARRAGGQGRDGHGEGPEEEADQARALEGQQGKQQRERQGDGRQAVAAGRRGRDRQRQGRAGQQHAQVRAQPVGLEQHDVGRGHHSHGQDDLQPEARQAGRHRQSPLSVERTLGPHLSGPSRAGVHGGGG